MPWALGVDVKDTLAVTVAWMVVFPVFFFSSFGLIVLGIAGILRRAEKRPATPEAQQGVQEK
ncbi:MAG TPA: hypothetical protein VNZ52_07795 [Candidatus Thermoplasmatota archaeon]|nr:hypothetical protein [Candidatus Thermoplasmatota archaeon]